MTLGTAHRVDRRALGVGLAGFAAFLDLYATQGMLPFLGSEFKVSALAASTTVSATTIAVALTAPFAGLLSDRVGRKPVLVAAALLLALPTLLAATAPNLQALVVWRALQGVCLPAIFATTVAYVGEESGASVGRTMASYVTGNILGGVVGRFVTALVAAHAGWREAFVILSVFNLVAAAALWLILPRSQHFVREAGGLGSLVRLGTHLKNPRLLAGYAVGFNILFSIVGTFTYVGFYLARPPFSLGTVLIGAIFFVYLIAALVTPWGGRLVDRRGARWVLVAGMGAASAGVLFTALPALWAVMLGLALCATGTFVCQSAANSYIANSSGSARSSSAGLYVSIYYLGGTAGAVVPGIAWRHGGWPACVAVIVGVQLCTAGLAWVGWRPRRAATATTEPLAV